MHGRADTSKLRLDVDTADRPLMPHNPRHASSRLDHGSPVCRPRDSPADCAAGRQRHQRRVGHQGVLPRRSAAISVVPEISGLAGPPAPTQGAGAGPDALAAARAQSVQLHVATVDLKSVQRRSLSVQRHGHLIEVDVPHLSAAPADEMMVVIRIDFELHGDAASLQRADQPGAHQFLHVAVDGRR
jgi:hypothetical protein